MDIALTISAFNKILNNSIFEGMVCNHNEFAITIHHLCSLIQNFIKSGNCEGDIQKDFYGNIISPFKALNNKVITPSEIEMNANPRSRSAKMRVAVKQ